jgi:hypothetical protein
MPSREDVVLAWGDAVPSFLTRKAWSRWAGGRWLGVEDGVAVYAVSNQPTLQRCEEFRSEVETALSSHFGGRVSVRLVIDTPDARRATAADETPDPLPPEEGVDLSDLRDAPAAAVPSPLDSLLDAFPGAEPMEE